MENIRSFLRPVPKERKRVTERGELLQYFVDEINKERFGTEFKEVTFGRMLRLCKGIKTKGLGSQNLYALSKSCAEAKRTGFGFGKKFFSSLKFGKV